MVYGHGYKRIKARILHSRSNEFCIGICMLLCVYVYEYEMVL